MIISVSNSTALNSAITGAHDGDTIQLSAGEYVLNYVQNLSFATGVTITSADPTHQAVIDGMVLQNDSGLIFKDLEVKVDPAQQVGVIVQGGGNIHLDSLNIHGTGTTDGLGIRVLNASNVTLSNLNIHDVSGGMGIVGSDTVSVLNSKIHDLEVDGIQTVGSSHVTLSGNSFTNFFPLPGDHSDAIQFFTFGTTTATHDLTITNNTYVRGAGEGAQGIFMNNEAGIPYENVTISGNAIIGGVYHGIAISQVDHLNLTGNIVEGYVDQTSWILIDRSTQSSETNNISTNYTYGTGNADLVISGDTTIPLAPIGDTSILGTATVVSPPPPPPTTVVTTSSPGVNHAPSGADETVSLAWNAAKTFAASDFGFSDPDGNHLLAVKIDTLPGVGTLTDNGVAVTAGQSVSAADIAAGKLVFHTPPTTAAAHVDITFQVQDDGGTLNGGVDTDPIANDVHIDVAQAPNHAPSGANESLSLAWKAAKTFSVADFGFSDPDGNHFLAVKIDSLPSAGTLTDNGVAVTAGQWVSVTDISAGKLVFQGPGGQNAAHVDITFQVKDDGGTANGGVDTDPTPNDIHIDTAGHLTTSGFHSSGWII